MKNICIVVLLMVSAVLWTDVQANDNTVSDESVSVALVHTLDAKFYSSVSGVISAPDPLMVLTPSRVVDQETPAKLTAEQQNYRGERIRELVASITAIEDREVGLSEKRKREIAEAALLAQEKTGVDAVLMVALARMESDFRGISQIQIPCKLGIQQVGCFADCGMTQHHVRGTAKYVIARCKELSRNVKESFLLSATEIAYHVKWCTARAKSPRYRPLRQCVLNRYNMGTNYATVLGCRRQHNCEKMLRVDKQNPEFANFEQAYTQCVARRRKCTLRASYWDRVSCFEYGARNHQRSIRNCRLCTDITKIARVFYKEPPPPPPPPPSPPAAPSAVAVDRSIPSTGLPEAGGTSQ